jgi:hypothetical protein
MANFADYKSVKATPPPTTRASNVGPSPLQDSIKESLKDGEWHAFLGVPIQKVGEKKRRKTGEMIPVYEYEVLVNELNRAKRQLNIGLNVRVELKPDNKEANIFFLAGEKREYKSQEKPDEPAKASASGKQESAAKKS